ACRLGAAAGGQGVGSAAGIHGGSDGVVLRLAGNGRLRGTVQDDRGRAVVSFALALSRPSGEAVTGARLSAVYTRYDAQGTFALEGVAAGTYRVLAAAQGRAPSAEQQVEVRPDPAPASGLRCVRAAGGRAR